MMQLIYLIRKRLVKSLLYDSNERYMMQLIQSTFSGYDGLRLDLVYTHTHTQWMHMCN